MNKKKVLMIIPPKNFRDEECFEPKDVLEKADVEIKVVSTTKGTARGMLGAKLDVETTVDEINPADYDAVVIVGGSGSKTYLWDNKRVLEIVKKANNLGKVVSAICISPVVLARAGLLSGRKATVSRSGETIRELEKAGAIILEAPVVVDGNIITGRGPDAGKQFGRKILESIT
ncbi:MAG: DJ-1/PfpI family protein [Candidatus Methylarchaceae archaeon HK01B]|nr:DJ-1/PfpI family protein [Candidatus Methylarchaceae archaeon HK01M]MCP8318368.1 DJ-1/PfpI family protein [Candidatus Methylarchaceae archaeon HK01B]